MLIVVIFALLLPLVFCQGGGMAELKSITGDEPYSGVGNAPATIPRPMGFWGRPRFAPGLYRPGYMGGAGCCPYGVDGPLIFDDMLGNAVVGSFTPSPYQPYYSRSAMHSSIAQPFQNSFPRSSPGSFGSFGSGRASPFNPSSMSSVSSPTGSRGSVSLSQATGGGFYQGKGNEMVGR